MYRETDRHERLNDTTIAHVKLTERQRLNRENRERENRENTYLTISLLTHRPARSNDRMTAQLQV